MTRTVELKETSHGLQEQPFPRIVEEFVWQRGRGRGLDGGSRAPCDHPSIPIHHVDLIRNIHGVAEVAELDGDEVGYLVSRLAEIKRIE